MVPVGVDLLLVCPRVGVAVGHRLPVGAMAGVVVLDRHTAVVRVARVWVGGGGLVLVL